jgi:hypothetical protein
MTQYSLRFLFAACPKFAKSLQQPSDSHHHSGFQLGGFQVG